jgi:electron transfer flavoprotein alpha subunit
MAVQLLVVSELVQGGLRKPSLEAISEARRIADKNSGKVTVLLIGSRLDEAGSVPARYGADTVIKVDDPKAAVYQPEFFAAAVKAAAESKNTDIILMPATDQGKDLAPRVAARLNAGLAEDCLKLQMDGAVLTAERPMYAGKVIAQVAIRSKVKVATLRPNVFEAVEKGAGNAAVESMALPDTPSRTKRKEFRAAQGAKLDVAEATIIVTGGRGMKEAANFKILEDLAQLLGGAVGATRAVVDAGWRPHSDQVGQTGKTVSPNLYMMFGASGSIQHWAGMSGARCIVAVNKSPEAPIMEKADYSLAADLFEVVPLFTEEIRKIKG